MSEKRLDPLAFTAVMVEREGKFFFFQPEIGVIASDTSLDGAYNKFVATRRLFLADIEQSGLTVAETANSTAVSVAMQGNHRGIAAEMGVFAVKLATVVVVIGALGAFAASAIGKAVGDAGASIASTFEGVGKISLADVSTKAAAIARDAKNLSPERKELLRQSVGTISRELQPLVEAWRNPPLAPSP
jgi:hypothetical protein